MRRGTPAHTPPRSCQRESTKAGDDTRQVRSEARKGKVDHCQWQRFKKARRDPTTAEGDASDAMGDGNDSEEEDAVDEADDDDDVKDEGGDVEGALPDVPEVNIMYIASPNRFSSDVASFSCADITGPPVTVPSWLPSV